MKQIDIQRIVDMLRILQRVPIESDRFTSALNMRLITSTALPKSIKLSSITKIVEQTQTELRQRDWVDEQRNKQLKEKAECNSNQSQSN